MKTVFLAFVSVLLVAQTSTRPLQQRVDPATANRVVVFLPNGSAAVALLDASSLALDTSVNPPVLRADTGASVREMDEVLRFSQPGALVVLQQVPTGKPLIYLNGLLQAVGEDYTLSGKQVTFWRSLDAGEQVHAVYKAAAQP